MNNSKKAFLSRHQSLIFACALSVSACFFPGPFAFGQDNDLEFTIDVASNVSVLPSVFKPSIDLSGRGYHNDISWPQELAAKNVLESWSTDVGFKGMYRLQYNLWQINQLAKDKAAQEKLIANYEWIIKKVSDAGGTVILDLFGMPPGLGKVLDKKSAPWNLNAFKKLVKSRIRDLSCNKKYNIWYEVWSAPDLGDFFLGRKQEYLNLYKAVAEAAQELEVETKASIPVGGPSTSWWFQNFDGNAIVNPENSLIYELIKFCFRYKLPLDFISWHAYSTDPSVEREITSYNKTPPALVRDWLSYFKLNKDIPLIVDEWNFDSGDNVLSERKENSFVCASYIPSRIKNMYKAGIDYQLFFSLEDFQDNMEGVKRNVGVFWFEQDAPNYQGGHKSIYNMFRMLASLGNTLVASSAKAGDEFIDLIATKKDDEVVILVYNYIDPDIFTNYLTRNIAGLNKAERAIMVSLLSQDQLEKIMRKELDFSRMHAHNKYNKVKNILKRAQELNDRATKYRFYARKIDVTVKNLNRLSAAGDAPRQEQPPAAAAEKVKYIYQRYIIDSSCSMNCNFVPIEEKEVVVNGNYQESFIVNPYSVNMIILKKKPKEPEPAAVVVEEQKAVEAAGAAAELSAEKTAAPPVPAPAPAAQNNAPVDQQPEGRKAPAVKSGAAAPVAQELTAPAAIKNGPEHKPAAPAQPEARKPIPAAGPQDEPSVDTQTQEQSE
jgi:hypothetical protein